MLLCVRRGIANLLVGQCTRRVYTVRKASDVPKEKATRPGKRTEQSRSTWDKASQKEPRSGLTRARVVQTGIEVADRDGLDALSIRRIAAELKSSPMALYHYVPSKRDLLNLILDALNAEFEWPASQIHDWRDALGHFARESRRSLKLHPWASALRATDPEYGPECIRTLEALLTSLAQSGLDMRTATRALGVLFVFVNGFVAAETGGVDRAHLSKNGRSASQPRFSRAILATGRFPQVSRFVEMGAELPNDEAFERALHWILDGIATDLKPSSTRGQMTQTRTVRKAARNSYLRNGEPA